MSAPSMVTRTGDSLVIRSVVSGNQLYVEEEEASLTPVPVQQNTLEKDLPQCKVKRNYVCNLCNYFTQNPRQHLHHLRDVHNEKVKIYECKDCLYASRHFQKLARHMRIVHDKDDSMSISDSVKEATLRRPRKRSRRPMDEMYEEDYGDIDEIIEDLNPPLENNNNKSKNPLKCSLCQFTTRHQGHLTRHERQDHIKTKFFRCVKCSYVTHIKARFTKHVKYHSMPMIKCDLCDFRTPYKWNLDRHNKNHNGHGAFKCCACNFTADIKQSLTVHEMNHHVPPVGQAAAAGLGVGRRRNKVGASDSIGITATPNNDESSDLLTGANKTISDQQIQLEMPVNAVNRSPNDSSIKSSPPPAKKKRPIPNLIPIQNTSMNKLLHQQHQNQQLAKYTDQAVLSPINISQQDLNELCAKSVNSSLRDFTSLFDDGNPYDVVEITAIKPDKLSPQTIALQKKNASFFDKLKEKLMTNAMSPVLSDDSNAPADNIICRGCGHVAKCLSEMSTHQKSCGKIVDEEQHITPHLVSSTRCQNCRQRCKSSADLIIHMQKCQKVSEVEEEKPKPPHPMENKVFVWNNIQEGGLDLSVPQAEVSEPEQVIHMPRQTQHQSNPSKPVTHGTDLDLAASNTNGGKRVFKCPHCSFWATTASRFHVHIVGHLNKKPFECSLCAYRSNWRWDITKHIRLKSVRDSAHQRAKVLMTDETGRRNYSKYNKYLMQMKESATPPAVVSSHPSPVGSSQSDSDLIFTKLPPGIKVTRTKINDSLEPNNNNESIKVQNDNLLDNNSAMYLNKGEQEHEPGSESPPPPQKRTLWKCKKCNFRDVDRKVLVQHVKEHYPSQTLKHVKEHYNRIDNKISTDNNNKQLQLGQTTITPISDKSGDEKSEQNDSQAMDENDNDEASVLLNEAGEAPFSCGHCHQKSNWKHVIQCFVSNPLNDN